MRRTLNAIFVAVFIGVILHDEFIKAGKPRVFLGDMKYMQKSRRLHAQEGMFAGLRCCVIEGHRCFINADCCLNHCKYKTLAGNTRRSHPVVDSLPTSHRSNLSSQKSTPYGTPTGSRTQSPVIMEKSTERLLPLVTNELVMAQGSCGTLVLTQGGGRCNDAQLQAERRIIKNDSKRTGPISNQVT